MSVSLSLQQLEKSLGEMKWKKNYRRKTVTPVQDKGCYSMSFGLVNKFEHGNHGIHALFPASNNTHHPQVYTQLQQLASTLHLQVTAFCINKNLQCRPHLDKRNVGDSTIVGLGDYQGGELIVEGEYIDIHYKPYCFNGSTKVHATAPFQGTRYSVIFYNERDRREK